MRSAFLLLLLCVAAPTTSSQQLQNDGRQQDSYHPEKGFVPDEATAVAIAEAVLLPIYGKETLSRERPFKAVLKGDIWTVTGTAHWRNKQDKGGVAVAEISRTDARIIRISHGM